MVIVKEAEPQWKDLKQWPQIEISDFENTETKIDNPEQLALVDYDLSRGLWTRWSPKVHSKLNYFLIIQRKQHQEGSQVTMDTYMFPCSHQFFPWKFLCSMKIST